MYCSRWGGDDEELAAHVGWLVDFLDESTQFFLSFSQCKVAGRPPSLLDGEICFVRWAWPTIGRGEAQYSVLTLAPPAGAYKRAVRPSLSQPLVQSCLARRRRKREVCCWIVPYCLRWSACVLLFLSLLLNEFLEYVLDSFILFFWFWLGVKWGISIHKPISAYSVWWLPNYMHYHLISPIVPLYFFPSALAGFLLAFFPFVCFWCNRWWSRLIVLSSSVIIAQQNHHLSAERLRSCSPLFFCLYLTQ